LRCSATAFGSPPGPLSALDGRVATERGIAHVEADLNRRKEKGPMTVRDLPDAGLEEEA
jgi:hypothetical protein